MSAPFDDLDQEERIKLLREQVEKLCGGISVTAEMPADLEEEFLRHVLEYESAEPISLFRVLENADFEIPPPKSMDDQQLEMKLMAVIERLSTLGAYLVHTDHLSDRSLYEYLYNEGLREEAVLFPENSSYAYIIDLAGSGSEEDNQAYLKYYADDAHRKQWAQDWPEDVIPEASVSPFNRDYRLPKAPML